MSEKLTKNHEVLNEFEDDDGRLFRYHVVDGELIIEVEDDGETCFYTVDVAFNPLHYWGSAFYRNAIRIMLESGATVNGITNTDILDKIDNIDLLYELYEEAKRTLPKEFVVVEEPDYWALWQVLDHKPFDD